MKSILLAAILFLFGSCYAGSVAEKLPGIYTAEGNCKSTMWIYGESDSLKVSARTDNGEFLFWAHIPLGISGQIYDCRHGGSYGQVECRVRENSKSISLQERGCLLFCGPWHLNLSIQDLDNSRVAVKWSDQQTESCIYQK